MIPEIVFLDLEGTLIQVPEFESATDVPASMWTILAGLLGKDCYIAEEQSKRDWIADPNLKYLDWMNSSVELFIKHGLNKSVLDTLIVDIRLYDGVLDFCDSMHRLGAKIAIVTGAIKNIAEEIQIKTRAEHLFAGCELYFDQEGNVQHWNLLPSDYRGKADFMRLLINEYQADPNKCVFIGDGKNDIHLAKEVGVSIAFNAQDELQRVCTYQIDQAPNEKNFYAATTIILNH